MRSENILKLLANHYNETENEVDRDRERLANKLARVISAYIIIAL